MRLRGLGAWILLQVLLQPWQLEVSAAGSDGPGKGNCHPECLKHGNCGDDGMCRCPFGRIGDGCEIDFLRPCKQLPDGIPSCGMLVTKSCECMRRCRKYHCRTDSTGQTHCETRDYASDRGCYMRDGVGQDEQFSLVPEANETGVKYFESYAEDAKEVPRGVALFDKSSKTESAPLSQCSSSCNGKGYCTTWDKQNYLCQCYRGYAGSMCELEAPSCILNCSGRGKCIDDFCHCKPPYFSIGCSRSKVYPKNYSKPNPAALKIYMYELNTQLAYDSAPHVGWKDNNEIYTAYRKFLARFLLSSVRTEDPSEASLFYIPSFTIYYSGNLGTGWEHTWLLLDDLRTKWPYWNQSGGADHFIWMPTDRGACRWGPGPMSSLIRVTHFGMHFTPTSGGYEHFGEKGHPDYGCHHPLKDIVALAYDPRMITALAGTSMNATLEGRFAAKKRLFFFAGDVRPNDLSYAGGTRVQLETLLKKWNDDDFSWTRGAVPNYLLAFQETKFCLAPYGHGFGMRLQQSILGDCVPVIIQEHVFQPYEDMLPYEEFSLRLSNADLPKLREILRGVSDAHYKQLLAGVFRFRNAFHWDEERGSQAFDYTVGSLRRRHQHLQSSLY